MRNIQKLVVAGLALAAGATFAAKPAAATPSTLGFYPSTDIYGKGVFHLDVDSYSKDVQGNLGSTSGITYGVGPDTDKAFGATEIGFDYNFTDVGTKVKADKRILFNAKTNLYSTKDGFKIVGGGWSLGSKSAGAFNYGYLAGSKTFEFGRITVGVAHAFEKTPFIGLSNSDRTSLQLGYDKMLTKELQFAADFYSGKGPQSGVQPTLYYYVNDKADFGLGYFRVNGKNSAAVRNQVYLCFDYNFDFNHAAK